MVAYIDILDVLDKTDKFVNIQGHELYANVDCTIVHTGGNKLEVNFLNIRSPVLYNIGSTREDWRDAKDLLDPPVYESLVAEFRSRVKELAKYVARNSPETEWEYTIET